MMTGNSFLVDKIIQKKLPFCTLGNPGVQRFIALQQISGTIKNLFRCYHLLVTCHPA